MPCPQMRKAANRMKFNEAEEEYIDGDEVVGLGVLGKEGTGRLRIVASQQKVKLNAKQQKKYKNRLTAGSGEGTNGLSSSLAFTPVQVRWYEAECRRMMVLVACPACKTTHPCLSGSTVMLAYFDA